MTFPGLNNIPRYNTPAVGNTGNNGGTSGAGGVNGGASTSVTEFDFQALKKLLAEQGKEALMAKLNEMQDQGIITELKQGKTSVTFKHEGKKYTISFLTAKLDNGKGKLDDSVRVSNSDLVATQQFSGEFVSGTLVADGYVIGGSPIGGAYTTTSKDKNGNTVIKEFNNGKLVSVTVKDPDGNVISKTESTYDTAGNIKTNKKTVYGFGGYVLNAEYSYDAATRKATARITVTFANNTIFDSTFVYSDCDQPKTQSDWDKLFAHSAVIGFNYKTSQTNEDGTESMTETEYKRSVDTNGNIEEEYTDTKYKPNSDEVESTTKTQNIYNSNGDLIETTITEYNDNNEIISKKTFKYEYDYENGTVTITEETYVPDETATQTRGMADEQLRLLSMTQRTVDIDSLKNALQNSRMSLGGNYGQEDNNTQSTMNNTDMGITELLNMLTTGIFDTNSIGELLRKLATMRDGNRLEQLLDELSSGITQTFFDENGNKTGTQETRPSYSGHKEQIFIKYDPETQQPTSMKGVEVVAQEVVENGRSVLKFTITYKEYDPETGVVKATTVTEHKTDVATGKLISTTITTRDENGHVVSHRTLNYSYDEDNKEYNVSISDFDIDSMSEDDKKHYNELEDEKKSIEEQLDGLIAKQANGTITNSEKTKIQQLMSELASINTELESILKLYQNESSITGTMTISAALLSLLLDKINGGNMDEDVLNDYLQSLADSATSFEYMDENGNKTDTSRTFDEDGNITGETGTITSSNGDEYRYSTDFEYDPNQTGPEKTPTKITLSFYGPNGFEGTIVATLNPETGEIDIEIKLWDELINDSIGQNSGSIGFTELIARLIEAIRNRQQNQNAPHRVASPTENQENQMLENMLHNILSKFA